MKGLWGIAILSFLLLTAACRDKKVISLQGDQPVTAADFVQFFEPISLPFTISDTALSKRPADSLIISLANMRVIVADTLLKKIKLKGAETRFYALGQVSVPDGETYLLIGQHNRTQASIMVFALSKDDSLINYLETISLPRKKDITQLFSIDRRFLFSITQVKKNKDGSLSEGKQVYALNQASGEFMLILTDALDEKPTELINPIDTLSTTQPNAGDYQNGKMNLVSIRDGRKPDRISFFVHFEKKNGTCIGELKGEAFWKTPRLAEYRQDGDPCILQFQFSNGVVTLREQRCGSRRSPDCLFDGSFVRKKMPRNKKKG